MRGLLTGQLVSRRPVLIVGFQFRVFILLIVVLVGCQPNSDRVSSTKSQDKDFKNMFLCVEGKLSGRSHQFEFGLMFVNMTLKMGWNKIGCQYFCTIRSKWGPLEIPEYS